SVIGNTYDPRRQEQQRHFGLYRDGYNKTHGGDGPLQPVLHPEFSEAVTRGEDKGDNGRSYAVEDRGHRRQTAEVRVEGTQCRYNDKIRKDKRPTSSPCSPEASTQIRNIDSNLNRERTGHRLTDRDSFTHLLLCKPLPLLNQLPLHLSN